MPVRWGALTERFDNLACFAAGHGSIVPKPLHHIVINLLRRPYLALKVVNSGLFWLQCNSQPEVSSLLPGGSFGWDVEYVHSRLVAVGDQGAVWRSSPLIQLEHPVKSLSPTGEIQWTLVVWGRPGATYELQSSADLQSLTPAGTAVATAERTELVLPIADSEQLFYHRIGSAIEATH